MHHPVIKESKVLGIKLRYCRKSAGLTQLQTGDLFELERSGISYYESGKIFPSITYLLNFSKTFNLSIDDLVNNDFTVENFMKKYPVTHFINIIERR